MGKNSEYYNVLLNDGIRNLLPFSDVLKPEDLRFESLDGKAWFLNIHGLSYRVHFIRNFNEVWGIRKFNNVSEPKPLFILDRITVEQAENLRRLDIEFMDKRGNAFLKLPKLYLFVSGRNMHPEANAPNLSGSPGFSGKLFKIAGVKLIYALLTDPELDVKPSKNLLNSTLRELAAIARISLGSSSDIMSELKEQGYAVEENGTLFLVNRKDLFRRWITGFFDYRPKWNTVRLESPSSDWWKKASLKDTNILWGGETAASILTKGFLSPERTILYTDKMIYDFVLEYGLRKVANGGDVELMAPLPCRHSRFRGDCVHPILVYADLIYSGNDRNREAAERIYDIYLKKIIEPD